MAQTEQLTLGEVSDRLDRLPASRFHAKILIVAALSLLFDTLDTAITGFVLASLRSVWHFDAKTIGVVAAIGLSGYLVGSAICVTDDSVVDAMDEEAPPLAGN